MVNLKFEGAIENISEYQLKFIEEVLLKRGYNDTAVQIEVLGEANDNYMANVKKITVNDSNGKPFKMIAKIASKHEQMRKSFSTHDLFLNEIIMYTEVFPKFKLLQQAANVPQSDVFRFAECYGCLRDELNELILLEDLIESNYIILDKLKSLSVECIKSVLKNLAIFHSLSYALKNKEPHMFQDCSNKLFDNWSNIAPGNLGYLELMQGSLLASMSDKNNRKTIFKGIPLNKIRDYSAKLSKMDYGMKHTIIQQGDCWTNNIMFKFENDILVESMMIDYQTSKETSPAVDVLFFILTCTDHQMRLKQYRDWIDYYYKELGRALAHYELQVSKIYPRDQLDADLKTYAKLTLLISTILASVMTMKSEDAAQFKDLMNEGLSQQLDKISTKTEETESDLLFRNRVEGYLDTLLEFGLL